RARLMELSGVVLLGEPGSGKTTTLSRLAWDYVDNHRQDNTQPLPVFVNLAQFNGQAPFAQFAASALGNLAPYREKLKLVWLLDSSNEMPRRGPEKPAGRALLPELLEFVRALGPQERFVLSCRARDYREDLQPIADVTRIDLRELGPDQIREIIGKHLS